LNLIPELLSQCLYIDLTAAILQGNPTECEYVCVCVCARARACDWLWSCDLHLHWV